MATKHDLQDWILEALRELGGSGTIVQVCRVVWSRHEDDLRQSDDLFFTWQYDIRWAAQKLRNGQKLMPKDGRRTSGWALPR